MVRLFRLLGVLAVVTLVATLMPTLGAMAASTNRVATTLPTSLSSNLPLLRLHFSAPTSANSLPRLSSKPALTTKWQQIGPNEVQAVALGALRPATVYTFRTPTTVRCAPVCTFVGLRSHVESVATNLTWEAQLLAQLHYLPLTFTPTTTQSDLSQQVNGTFTWSYPDLPASLSAQWRLGSDNVILHAALMTFQSQSSLPVTGEADATTWARLATAALANNRDPAAYNYVVVAMGQPETLTMYVAGHATFRALVNTGISVSPTALGTYPVYLRYVTQTMSGTNPDGSHYSDPGIPWVSYFNGGDALHGFLRSTYGWRQSLGCVEMTFASAKTVYPHTPIGTLVTVRA